MTREELVKQLSHQHSALKRYIRRRLNDYSTRSSQLVDEIYSDVIASALRSCHQFRSEGTESFEYWINKIAISRVSDYFKYTHRDCRNPGVPIEEFRDSVPGVMEALGHRPQTSPSGNMRREESRKNVNDSIQKLPDLWRDAVKLRFGEDLTFEETADRLGISPTSVRRIIAEALQLIRLNLGSRGGYI